MVCSRGANRYCSNRCRKKHWRSESHAKRCSRSKADPDSSDDDGDIDNDDLDDTTTQLRVHHKAFQEVVKKYKLAEGKKADKLADYLTRAG